MLGWALSVFERLMARREQPPPLRAPERFRSAFWEGDEPPLRQGDVISVDENGWTRRYYETRPQPPPGPLIIG